MKRTYVIVTRSGDADIRVTDVQADKPHARMYSDNEKLEIEVVANRPFPLVSIEAILRESEKGVVVSGIALRFIVELTWLMRIERYTARYTGAVFEVIVNE